MAQASTPAAMFTLTSAVSSGPRLGVMLNKQATPAISMCTQHGLPVNITADQLKALPEVSTFHLTMDELAVHPGRHIESFPGGLRAYLAYRPSDILIVSVRDSIGTEYGPCNDTSFTIQSSKGNQRLTPRQYLSLCSMYQPNAVELMTDEVAGTTTRNRSMKSVQRTFLWLKQQLQQLFVEPAQTPQESIIAMKESEQPPTKRQRRTEPAVIPAVDEAKLQSAVLPAERDSFIIAPIVGGKYIDHRLESWKRMKPFSHLIDAFGVTGLGIGESEAERTAVLKQVTCSLPANKLRIASDLQSYRDFVTAIDCGIDLIHTTLPHRLTQRGVASIWSLAKPDVLPEELSLNDPQWSRHNGPLVEGCQCFACRNHTRGYIQHLLNVKEMNAYILLDHHNWHVCSEFIAHSRSLIAAGGDAWALYRDRVQPVVAVEPVAESADQTPVVQ